MNSEQILTALEHEIIDTGKKLLGYGLVVSTWGNISCRSDNQVIITPSGVDYNHLEAGQLPLVFLTGEMASGSLKPSSELPMHLAIYHARQDVQAIVHCHSTYATCCAVLHQPIPVLVEDMAMVVGGEVAVAQYFLPGTQQLAESVTAALGTKNAVLMANHGLVGVGPNLNEALKACLLTEKVAQIYLMAKGIGTPVSLSEEDVEQMKTIYRTSYGQK